ncbi:MAG: glycosyltransferase family 4 protein [Chloroflexi bacterium]|nr:glycosyltransferase family 1 protein [Chloroflexota bacterium]NOG35199.1 glycosyltransferase family 4 protein [Chloroflexota bacterium]GIK54535.1 MAG: glycosyl transferase family 1 [Chloroflexota bacterium]
MRILEVLTYYRPWVSGLTIYVERLSRALAQQGHDVTVLTSQYDRKLPLYDLQDGVKIVRVPVTFRVSKGVIMPGFGPMAWKLAQKADVIHLHLPQFDAPGVALRGRLMDKPVVLTYHCDLQLPEGGFNRLVDRVVHSMNRLAGNLADAVVTYTRDYGTHSPYLSQYLGKKLHIIPPPVALAYCSDEAAQQFCEAQELHGRPVIGIAARLATEKGVEVLLNALPTVLAAFPDAIVLHAGPYKHILGEEAYAARLAPLFAKYKNHYRLLGNLEGADLTAFYKNLDVLCVTSLNSTESFGLVQIEAMQNGVPVVVCALPGVRQPVTLTGMGEVTPIGDHEALAEAIIRILSDKRRYQRDARLIADSFSPAQTAVAYTQLFQDLLDGRHDPTTREPAAYERLRQMRDGWESSER